MNKIHIASFESKTRGPVEVFAGHDDKTVEEIYRHSSDPGIVATLGDKDLVKRFAPKVFASWAEKNGGRFMYTAWTAGALAAVFWIGGEKFPKEHFPNSPLRPLYTAAWRTAYSAPEGEGHTFAGEGIGKRIALAGITHVISLTQNGGPRMVEGDGVIDLPPLEQAGLWLDTGVGNKKGQDLYHYLGNTARGQEPVGFVDVGVFTPPFKEGAPATESEPRVGMVADQATIQRLVAAGGLLLDMVAA